MRQTRTRIYATKPNIKTKPEPVATPNPEIKEIPTTPYLYLPFKASELPQIDGKPFWEVSQGWEAEDGDKRIAKVQGHTAVDIRVPFGTRLYSLCDAWAICSLQEVWRVVAGQQIYHDNKKVAYGGGLFVELVREDGRRVQILHLSEIAENIPFARAIGGKETGWAPTLHNLPLSELKDKKAVIFVDKGQYLGKVGYSGLGLGAFINYNGESKSPILRPEDIQTYDPAGAHAHIEEFERNPQSPYGKMNQRDIFGIGKGGKRQDYPSPANPKPISPRSLVFSQNGQFLYAA